MYVKETKNAFSVSRETMVSQEIFDRERDAIFNQVWLYVGHESEVSALNDFQTRDVGNRSIILVRDSEDNIRVFLNVCSHRGAEVCRMRKGNAKAFMCVYHAWTYKNDGRLTTIPAVETFPKDFPKEEMGLSSPPRVESYRGFVFLSFNPDVEPLAEWLAGARHYLDLIEDQSAAPLQVLTGTHEYGMQANWKLLVENSADGYHGMSVHSTYFDHMRRVGDDVSSSTRYAASHAYDLGNGHAISVRITPMSRSVARWTPSMGEGVKPAIEARQAELTERLGEERAYEVSNTDYNLVIFPNLIVLNAMGVVVRAFTPVAPDKLKVTAWMMAPNDLSEDETVSMLDQSLAFFGPGGMATPDDAGILESVQRGLRAWREAPWSDISKGLTKAEPDSRDELQMRVFWRHYEMLMAAQAETAA